MFSSELTLLSQPATLIAAQSQTFVLSLRSDTISAVCSAPKFTAECTVAMAAGIPGAQHTHIKFWKVGGSFTQNDGT